MDTGSAHLLEFVYLHSFDRSASGLLDDDDLRVLEQTLNESPRAGAVIAGTGGVRKLRVASSGRGKRGGSRVLYLYVEIRSRIYLIAVIPKNEQPDLTRAAYRDISALVSRLRNER